MWSDHVLQAQGTARMSFVSSLLEEEATSQKEELVKWAAFSLYAGEPPSQYDVLIGFTDEIVRGSRYGEIFSLGEATCPHIRYRPSPLYLRSSS